MDTAGTEHPADTATPPTGRDTGRDRPRVPAPRDRRTVLLAGAGLAAGLVPALAACDSGSASDGAAPGRSPSSGGSPSRSAGPSASPSPRPARAADWAALAKDLDGDLVRPGDTDYDTARRLYNPRFHSAEPDAVAYCERPEDVRQVLAFARRFGSPLAVRAGGHSYAGWSAGEGVILDVSRMDSVETAGGSAAIGAGAKLLDVYERLAARGATVPGGSCPSVAIGGLTLGGGHGVVSRAYGLTCDSLTAAEVVLADGRAVRATKNEEADLFWALRGAGNGNFGVVTSLEFATRPAADCTTFYATWPWSRAAAVLRAWQDWGPSAPDELWSHVTLLAHTGQEPQVTAGGLLLGGAAELDRHLDRLVDAAGPAASLSTRPRSYLDAMVYMAGCVEATRCSGATERAYTARSHFFTGALPDGANEAMAARMDRLRGLPAGGIGSAQFTALGGAVNRVAPDATAFVHRRSASMAQYIAEWEPDAAPSTADRVTDWLAGTHTAMSRYAGPGAYQNYADPTLRDWREAYYGANADRLARVKTAYDPDRLFDYPQAV